jgi:hypothetical protein
MCSGPQVRDERNAVYGTVYCTNLQERKSLFTGAGDPWTPILRRFTQTILVQALLH